MVSLVTGCGTGTTSVTVTSGDPAPARYVDPQSPMLRQADEWEATRPADAAVLRAAAHTPAFYFGHEWTADPEGWAAEVMRRADGTLPVVAVYDIPHRDTCGAFSAGGAATAADYRVFVNAIARGLAGRDAIVIVEPDALADLNCLTPEQQHERLDLIGYAVDAFDAQRVYVDGGNPTWRTAGVMAHRINLVGADGFTVNVHTYHSTEASAAYGQQVAAMTGATFIIDTGRNGNGDVDGTGQQWCNPPGRALGAAPTLDTGIPNIDAYLWVKSPGESDGDCGRGEPGAGVWWPERALELARGAQ
jgi:endoglucanase